jgi:pyridoxal phosphate enzyme (YggS family)
MTTANPPLRDAYEGVLQSLNRVAAGTAGPPPQLVAVSKTRTVDDIAQLHALGQRAFGENYVQEAVAKQAELAGDPRTDGLEWHLIGHLQSNKAAVAAQAFDWVQTVDRIKLVPLLAAARPADRPPLDVLIQVNIDDETSKHGCRPGDVAALADAIAAQPRLRLRGLMAIPAPLPDMDRRRDAFRRMKALFDAQAARFPAIDTLSMGMSEDFELAIAEGATMVRVGTALFGERPPRG